MKKKVTYVISDIKRALAFEWIADYLDKEQFELSFVLLNKDDSVLEQHLRAKNVNVTRINCAGKKNMALCLAQTLYLLQKTQT